MQDRWVKIVYQLKRAFFLSYEGHAAVTSAMFVMGSGMSASLGAGRQIWPYPLESGSEEFGHKVLPISSHTISICHGQNELPWAGTIMPCHPSPLLGTPKTMPLTTTPWPLRFLGDDMTLKVGDWGGLSCAWGSHQQPPEPTS